MYTGFYAAASGLTAKTRALDIMGNNIANSDTAGYKKDFLVSSSFGEHLQSFNGRDVGSASFGNRAEVTETSFEQGAESKTGRPLDFFISGEGFFNILMPDGTSRLTRNGQFSLDQNGFLTDDRGNMVLCQNGSVMIGNAEFTVDETGRIYSDGDYLDTLNLICPDDLNNLSKAGEGYYINAGAGNHDFAGRVIQGSKELSNIEMVKEMADMIASSRGFQSCSQVIKMYDQIMSKSANEVGKL